MKVLRHHGNSSTCNVTRQKKRKLPLKTSQCLCLLSQRKPQQGRGEADPTRASRKYRQPGAQYDFIPLNPECFRKFPERSWCYNFLYKLFMWDYNRLTIEFDEVCKREKFELAMPTLLRGMPSSCCLEPQGRRAYNTPLSQRFAHNRRACK